LRFEWDSNKKKQNAIKHGVTFKEAESVFDDENAITLEDAVHSLDEDRFIIIGLSIYPRELAVCHCHRDSDIIRIISARKATKKNPYADKIKKYGYTIRIHYSPEDVANMNARAIEKIDGLEDTEWLDLDPSEIWALKKYREANKV
jgi:hypothetical protein